MQLLLTGFPGFLGSELLPRLLARTDDEAVCLVQAKFRALAERRAAEIEAAHPQLRGRIRLVEGDITRPLDHLDPSHVRELWHLAAVYDLSVRRDVGLAVNVDGTRHILDLAGRAPRLERLHYVSTCYVSGRLPGRFLEDDLERGQAFNNFYEETKYLAELEVRKRMDAIPSTIYRPAVVTGDATTGATQKYDGPYYVMQWLMRQPKLAVLPVAGNPRAFTFNVVPRDFVIAALMHLSARSDGAGLTYALADPNPLTVDATIDAFADATGRRVLRVPLPKAVAKGALAYVPGVYRLLKIPAAAVDYFVHPTTYDTRNADAHLAGSGIRVPPLRDYVERLVDFARKHPEVGAEAMA